MKKKSLALSLFLSVLLCWGPSALAKDGWKMVKNADGVKLYERPAATRPLMEFMAVTTFDARMEVIGEVLRDVASWPRWQTDCKEARILKQINKNDMITQMILNPPVISKRDIVLKAETVYDYDHGKTLISFAANNEMIVPPEKGYVRVTVMNGFYEMEYLGRDKTKFVYLLMVDPAGSISKRIAYRVIRYYPFKTLTDLRTMVGKQEYADKVKGTEEEVRIDDRMKDEDSVRGIFSARLSSFASDKAAMGAVIQADPEGIREIIASGGSYEVVKHVTTRCLTRYIEKIIQDKAIARNLTGDSRGMAELTDMIESECGAEDKTIESIIAEFN